MMTETREQWIEREALINALVNAKQQRDILASKLLSRGVAVRDLYSEDDGKPFGGWHFEDGYKIVPNREPVSSPYKFSEPQTRREWTEEDVDGLADAIRCAEGRYWKWEDISEASQKGFRKCARAALAYLNIEPCAAPEYNPDDVVMTPTPTNITIEGVDLSRMVFFINGKHLVPQSALDEALAKVERQRQALEANRKVIEPMGVELAQMKAEVKRLRQWQDSVMKAVNLPEVPK